ncbi:MAG TPA: signal peptidase I [Streptosporangiaceae bacterium]|nr:signal peptidase I [Streptosporangiaceae bacterium]
MTNDDLDTADPREADDDQPDEDDSEESNRGRWSFLTEMVVLFAVALTIALLIKTFVVQPFFIPSGSMENTLLIGDKVLVNKLVYHLRPIERGDIVVFNGTGSWDIPPPASQASRNPVSRLYEDTLGALFHSIAGLFGTPTEQAGYVQTDYIKRVIGVPGDHVMCCNARGQLEVNGVALAEKSYIFPGAPPSQDPFSVVVPPGRLWVMGDNRSASADSRFHDCAYSDPGVDCQPFDRDGTIPENKVIGRAFLIVWPPVRIRALPIPSTFDQAAIGHPGGGTAAAKSGTAPASLLAADGSVTLRPSAPYLPLGLGLTAVVPVTVTERWLRKRIRRRRRVKAAG